jgi:hypothetical protein
VEQDCVVLLVMGWCVSRWIRPSWDSVLDWEMLINVCLLATEKVYTTFFWPISQRELRGRCDLVGKSR